jgi:hypothetical protein
MENGIHFISGLPRSGSTLLAAILRQNPHFHATISSLRKGRMIPAVLRPFQKIVGLLAGAAF